MLGAGAGRARIAASGSHAALRPSGPSDGSCDGANIRSGNPGDVSRITLSHPLLAPGYAIENVSLAFRYAAGYTPAAGVTHNASVASLLLVDENGDVLNSSAVTRPLGNFSFDHFTSYSPPVPLSLAAAGVPNDRLVFVAIEVRNNQRNLQIALDDLRSGFNASVSWSKARAAGHAHAHAHAGPAVTLVAA